VVLDKCEVLRWNPRSTKKRKDNCYTGFRFHFSEVLRFLDAGRRPEVARGWGGGQLALKWYGFQLGSNKLCGGAAGDSHTTL
jgi:hypothetical protein